MRPDEIHANLAPLHAAADRAWVKVGAAATALLAPHAPDEHAGLWRELEVATEEYDAAVARLAALTQIVTTTTGKAA